MRRLLGLMMCAGLLVTGAAGCSDDDKKDDKSAGGDVGAYCEAVDDYVAKIKEAQGDATKAAALGSEATKLGAEAAKLAKSGLSADDAKKMNDCSEASAAALSEG